MIGKIIKALDRGAAIAFHVARALVALRDRITPLVSVQVRLNLGTSTEAEARHMLERMQYLRGFVSAHLVPSGPQWNIVAWFDATHLPKA